MGLSVLGCGNDQPKLVEVTGRVTLAGKGLSAGSITFHPTAENSFQSDSRAVSCSWMEVFGCERGLGVTVCRQAAIE
jgi:hypothetical protein